MSSTCVGSNSIATMLDKQFLLLQAIHTLLLNFVWAQLQTSVWTAQCTRQWTIHTLSIVVCYNLLLSAVGAVLQLDRYGAFPGVCQQPQEKGDSPTLRSSVQPCPRKQVAINGDE